MKLIIEQDKENLEKNYISKEVFSKKVTDYFTKNQTNALNDSLDIKDKIKARMNAILTEYYMINMAGNINNITSFEKMFANEYRSLSYEYGKLLGLMDEEIINRGILANNDIRGYVLYELMREGRDIEDIFDNYYIERENNNHYYAKRDENGKIEQPNIGHAMGMIMYKMPFSNSERDELNKEGIRTDYYYKYYDEPGKKFNIFLENYYKQTGYENFNINSSSYINKLDPYIRDMQQEYSFNSNDVIVLKSEKECKLYDNLIQSAQGINQISTADKII